MNWRTGSLVALVFVAGLYVLFAIATKPAQGPAHQVFFNGQVLTMDASNSMTEAVSIRNGRIDRVGSSEDILATVDERTDVVDLHGRTLMPGFVDAHGHFPGSGQSVFNADLRSPPVGTITTMAELVDALQAFAESHPEGWIVGNGYDDTLLEEGRHPTRDDLDRVSSTRPVAIVHISGHLASVNSVALAAMGIDETTPDPEGGLIVRDPSSPDGLRPNGVLEETAARQVYQYTLDLGVGDLLRMTTFAGQQYLSRGVTTASAGGMPTALAKILGPMSQINIFTNRVALFPMLEEVEDAILSGELTLASLEGGRVVVPRVKIVADGSIQGFTGYLGHPYHTPYKGDAEYRGYPSVSREDLFRLVNALYEREIQVAIHCNGDASLDDALDAIANAQQSRPWPEGRPLIIHAQMARQDQVQRMASLGVTPSFFSAHTFYWGDRHMAIFMGPERAQNMSPARWAIESGVRYSSHMDTPVTPMLPLQAVWSQVYRISTGGQQIGDYQRVDVMTALRAVTIDAAWQVFMDDEIGSIEPGKAADLIVLSESPLTAADLRDITVERTLIDGATVFSRH